MTTGHHQRRPPAHAVTGGTEPITGHFRATGQVVEEGAGVNGHHVRCHAGDHRHQPLAFLLVTENGLHVNGSPFAEPVVDVRQQDGVPEAGQCGGHFVEGVAHTAGVGIHDHTRPGPLPVWGEQANGAAAVGGGDAVGDVRHASVLLSPLRRKLAACR